MSQLALEAVTDYRLSHRARVVQALADFRHEWQKTAEGKNLVDVEASIGLILADLAERLELNSQERYVMLGGKLINQINAVMEERISATL